MWRGGWVNFWILGIVGMNRVEIKRNGLRFGQNEAYGCQKGFGMPPETKHTNKKMKISKNIEQYQNPIINRFFLYIPY